MCNEPTTPVPQEDEEDEQEDRLDLVNGLIDSLVDAENWCDNILASSDFDATEKAYIRTLKAQIEAKVDYINTNS